MTNTLDDPYVADNQLAQGLLPIAQSRRKANKIKKDAHITVVIGNPPYRLPAEGLGGWVEHGSASGGVAGRAVLDDFRTEGNGRVEYALKNLYVYFWRWATWKVWESTRSDIDGDAGVICFITSAGYTKGPGFRGMRRYLREWASEGWVIDLTPEGQTPDVPTRVFPGVRQPLAIALFVRKPGKGRAAPAHIRVRAVSGRRAEKFAQLAAVTLAGDGWEDARPDWAAPLTVAATNGWDEFPALGDLMPWSSPGIKANRTWVFAPAAGILGRRWARLTNEADASARGALFKEIRDRSLARPCAPLPGQGTGALPALDLYAGPMTTPVRVGYRSFDRQWLIPDARAIDFARPSLWAARVPGQMFVVEQHAEPIESGPGLVFSALMPDMHTFNNRGGRTLPLLHPDGTANLAPGLPAALAAALSLPAPAPVTDVLAYTAAVVAHPAFTHHFADELATPGIRVPVTGERTLWNETVEIGRRVLWLHTYGVEFRGDDRGETITLPSGDPRKPLSVTPITAMPDTMTYDQATQTLTLGTGTFAPVAPEVWEYAVGGRGVLKSWFNYRKRVPGGKKSSPLDDMHMDSWPAAWTTELIELLSVLIQLVELEEQQADLLARVLGGTLVSTSDLEAAGVAWPKTKAQRAPRLPLGAVTDGSTLL